MNDSRGVPVLQYLCESCGPIYSPLLLLSIGGLFITSCAFLFSTRSRKPFVVLIALSCLPLAIGAFGTLHGFLYVQRLEARLERDGTSLTDEQREDYASANRVTTYVGAAGTIPLLVLSLFGFASKPRSVVMAELTP